MAVPSVHAIYTEIVGIVHNKIISAIIIAQSHSVTARVRDVTVTCGVILAYKTCSIS